ncbi:MAG: MGMT family protein [Kiritimatiellales bacterium]|jgi:O-6-methylguanine DNA methyltransferase
MKPVAIKTTWGTITLKLNDDGRAVELSLPPLNQIPHKKFSEADFEALENMMRDFRPAGIPAGTKFQQAVWREMKKIPRGRTRTYGEIAAAIGRPKAVRAVGSACGANPLPVFIPCHRVVAANSLGGFGSGLPWKILLLKMEGAL